MKSIQNAKDHDISIASLKSAAATKKKGGRSKCVYWIFTCNISEKEVKLRSIPN